MREAPSSTLPVTVHRNRRPGPQWGIAALILAALVLSGCNDSAGQPGTSTSTPPSSSASESPTPSPSGTLAAVLRESADAVLEAIRDKDYESLAETTDPVAGLRFSPYAFVDIDNDVVVPAEDVAGLGKDDSLRTWGSFDGTGDPITMDFRDYRDRFIWDHDYLEAEQVGVNEVIGAGNTLNNLAEAYPGDSFVEYHFPGFDPKYEGMDWRSLRVVMRPSSHGWTLVGLVHDEWTT